MFYKKNLYVYLIVMLYGIATANHLNRWDEPRFHAFILLRIDRVHLSAGKLFAAQSGWTFKKSSAPKYSGKNEHVRTQILEGLV